MAKALLNYVVRFLSLSWVTGPIFDKELRVSSRRRRNYVLRFAYVALLTVFLALFWMRSVPSRGSGLYQSSRMAEAGKIMTAFVVWFQFIATQLIAGIMLSTSVSDEIYNKTLGLLMTTPINSFQVVTGKLLSKLLQLLLLLAISLPLLAIVRVFGGVPWGYIVSGLCVTLTTVLFIGSLSLFFSIFSRRAYVVIILGILTVGVLSVLLPVLAAMFLYPYVSESEFLSALSYLNPYVVLFFETEGMASARAVGPVGGWHWPVQCIVSLGASCFLLFLSMLMVRRAGLRQATGQLGASARKRRPKTSDLGVGGEERDFGRAPRRVRGSAILWKELRSPLFGRRKIAFAIVIAVGLILLFSTYAFFADHDALDEDGVHILYGVIFMGMGTLFTIVIPATCITSEKESRAWPLLLATTLSEWQILFGKFAGIVRRCLPIWCVLFGHIILFTIARIIHPIALFQVGMVVAGLVVFLSGTGLYFSSRFKHTTTAVIVNFALAGIIWALLPLLMSLTTAIEVVDWNIVGSYLDTNPFVHLIVVIDATTSRGGRNDYYWLEYGGRGVLAATIWIVICMLGYMLLGLLFAWRAKCRLRRNIF
jgi:ABC-type transport system involved in multi-copper enzyme maturation permease subunit